MSGRRSATGTGASSTWAVRSACAGGWWWWQAHRPWLPLGFAEGNGRIEADEIEVSPKYAGRVSELLADEGDLVKAGQVVAKMDVRDIGASLLRAKAQVEQARHALSEANSAAQMRKADVTLADQQIGRTRRLFNDGDASREQLDMREQSLASAKAAQAAALARIGEAEHALDAAQQEVAYYQIMNNDGALVAPRLARVEYRFINTGEVVGAGAKIMTLIDLSNVYMTVFLPTDQAGKVEIGTEGRIVLDALPDIVIPAHVSFVSPSSQFTPKMVETKNEREKLMFRIKVRVDPDVLAKHADKVRTGLPGVAYVRLDPKTPWPQRLTPNVPE
jgi:HlyD family secretion protein